MREFLECFREQRRLHPSMQVQDAVKLCYQAAFGAAHLLKDKGARSALASEFAAIKPDGSVPLWEDIGGGHVRVNLAAWKAQGRDARTLFSLLLQEGKEMDIAPFLLVAESEWGDKGAFARFVREWRARGCPPLHHSAIYREKEKPAYRVVEKSVTKVLHNA